MSSLNANTDLSVVERALVQSGQAVSDPVGLRPRDHFDGAAKSSGRAVRLSLRPGFDLSVYDLDLSTPQDVAATTEPCLAIVLLLSGHGAGQIRNAGPDFPATPYRAGYLYVSLAREVVSGLARADQDERFRVVELRLSLPFLERTGTLSLFAKADRTNRLHHASNAALWVGCAPAPANLLLDARAIFTDVLGDTTTDIRVEARALTLFDNVVALMRVSQSDEPPRSVSDRDGAKLEAARTLMFSDLAYPWTIPLIARAVGLNQRRLKEGFRQRFGLPVHATLQAARVEHGRSLLLTGMTVTEVSLAVGYSNPSHFARLFRRAYGIAPSACR